LTSWVQGNVMDHHCVSCPHVGRKTSKSLLKRLCPAVTVALLAALLSACNDGSAAVVKPGMYVRTEIVQPRVRQGSVTLTGDVKARFSADLSFRVSGRVRERLIEIGAHVVPGAVLTRLDATEQQADLDAAIAAVTAAEAQLRVAKATFDRQNHLIASGFTTRVAFDQAQEGLRTAEGSLERAKAQQGTAKDALGYTELRANASGVITARSLEVGQVVEAGHPVFSVAQDGERDAVFEIYEAIFFGDFDGGPISLTLLSDPRVKATGYVREVSPAINAKTSTIRVKVTIQDPPAAMTLGSSVAGTAKWNPVAEIALPWTALMAAGSKPAVWVVDPSTNTALLKPVTIGRYEAGAVVIQDGLEPGERVVVDGGKLLSFGQLVSYADGSS
jgi:membrane fusion protein, multidrug efflux system